MSAVNERFLPYAHAEKELSDKAGPLLTAIIKEIEERNGIQIAEIRVTLEKPGSKALWAGANCTIVR